MFLNRPRRYRGENQRLVHRGLFSYLPPMGPSHVLGSVGHLTLTKGHTYYSCSRPRLWKVIPKDSKVFIPKPPVSELQAGMTLHSNSQEKVFLFIRVFLQQVPLQTQKKHLISKQPSSQHTHFLLLRCNQHPLTTERLSQSLQPCTQNISITHSHPGLSHPHRKSNPLWVYRTLVVSPPSDGSRCKRDDHKGTHWLPWAGGQSALAVPLLHPKGLPKAPPC